MTGLWSIWRWILVWKHPDFDVVGEAQIRRLDGKVAGSGDESEFALKRYSGGRFVNVFPDVVAIGPDGRSSCWSLSIR